MMEDDMKNRGFTLIELMIVVAIIGILAAIAVPAINERNAEPEPVAAPVQTEREKFESHVDPNCVEKYGKFACEYQ